MCDLLVFFIFAAKKGKSIYDNLYFDVVLEKTKTHYLNGFFFGSYQKYKEKNTFDFCVLS